MISCSDSFGKYRDRSNLGLADRRAPLSTLPYAALISYKAGSVANCWRKCLKKSFDIQKQYTKYINKSVENSSA